MRGDNVQASGRRIPENIGDLNLEAAGVARDGRGNVKDRRGATPHQEMAEVRRRQ